MRHEIFNKRLDGKEGNPAKIRHDNVWHDGIYVGRRQHFDTDHIFAWRGSYYTIERLTLSSTDMAFNPEIKEGIIIAKHRWGDHVTMPVNPVKDQWIKYASSLDQALEMYKELDEMLG